MKNFLQYVLWRIEKWALASKGEENTIPLNGRLVEEWE